MIRVLVIIAVTGFLVSVVSLSAAVGIAGPDAIERGWSWSPDGRWNFGRDFDGWDVHYHRANRTDRDDGGARTTREIAWTGGASVGFDLPANVTYTQASGPAKLVVTGPRDDVADVEIDDGNVHFSRDRRRDSDLTIVMTAPSVTRFSLSGSGKLAIANYNQDSLTLDLPGDADVTANGEARAIDLDIQGSASADFSHLKARSATVNIEGSGTATLAPSETAKVDISGSGDVTLLSHPPKLESHVTGSGEIIQEDGGSPTAAPSGPAQVSKRAGRT